MYVSGYNIFTYSNEFLEQKLTGYRFGKDTHKQTQIKREKEKEKEKIDERFIAAANENNIKSLKKKNWEMGIKEEKDWV